MAIATPPAPPLLTARSSSASLQARAASLKHIEIDYIPNDSFEFSDIRSLPAQATSVGNQAADPLPTDLPAYLGRLCATSLLTPSDEAALFRHMNYAKFLASQLRDRLDENTPDLATMDAIESLLDQARDIRDHIIQANLRLVISIVKKFVTPAQSFDELLSEGTVTLMQAVEKFDFDRGFRFSTYAYRSISRTAYRYVANARQEEARVTRDAEEWAFGQSDDHASSSMSDQLWHGLRDMTASLLARLDRRERLIIRSRYALGSHRRVRSFQDLANRLGVSKERVRQIESRAVSKLQTMAKELDLDSMRMSVS